MNMIEAFTKIISSIDPIGLWTYDRNGTLLSADTAEDLDLETETTEEHVASLLRAVESTSKPSILPSFLETYCIVDAIRDQDGIENIYALGPIYVDTFPDVAVKDAVCKLNLSLDRKQKLYGLLRKVPTISFTKVVDYTIMMHYALTGEKVDVFELNVVNMPSTQIPSDEETQYHGTYEDEAEMLRMVREGDLRIIEHLKKMATNVNVGKLVANSSDPLRQMKNTIYVAITLFSRAAIDGGLYPDTAMTLTDRYFQAVEAATTYQEITGIASTMQADFVNRVHKIRQDASSSKTIRAIKEYVDLHKEDEIVLKDLANELGYTEYYLTKKFKKETGITFKEYLRDVRLDYAIFLLEHSAISIREISERLHFPSQSYFSQIFKEKYQTTPKEYRLNGLTENKRP